MDVTRHCVYTDPRDRVYAILGLLKEELHVEPDYEKTISQVYQDVTLHYINSQDIDILTLCELNDKQSEMPSWVPDWTVVDTPEPFPWGDYSRYSTSVKYRGGGILNVTGKTSATVQHVERMEYKEHARSLVTELQRIAPRDVLRGSYIAGGSLLTAFSNAICATAYGDDRCPPDKWLPTVQQCLDFLSAILQPGEERIPDHSPNTMAFTLLTAVWSCCRKRSYITTIEGYIGLAPATAQHGDKVCVLLGCRTPILLRRTSNLQYQVVGPCYVQGLMNGEAFLGAIPKHYEIKNIYCNWSRNYFRAYLDRRTGKTQDEDPRLTSPPRDEHCKGISSSVLPDEPRSQVVTPEMIEKRGVKLETFDLI